MTDTKHIEVVLPPLHNEVGSTIGLRVSLAHTKGFTPAQQEAFWRGVALVMAAAQRQEHAAAGERDG
jgi:hypothetical protein